MFLAKKYAFFSQMRVFLKYAFKKRISKNAYFLEHTHKSCTHIYQYNTHKTNQPLHCWVPTAAASATRPTEQKKWLKAPNVVAYFMHP